MSGGRFVVHVKHARRAGDREGSLQFNPRLILLGLSAFALFFATGGLLGYLFYNGKGSASSSMSGSGTPAAPVCTNTCSKVARGDKGLHVCSEGRGSGFVQQGNGSHFVVLCDLGTDCIACGPWQGVPLQQKAALTWGDRAGPIAFLQAEKLEVRIRPTTTNPPFQIAYGDPQLDRGVSDALHRTGMYEGGNTLLVHKMLAGKCVHTDGSRALVLDVGANLGYFTLLAASLGCKVIAWEPVPAFRAYLAHSVAVNGYGHLVQIRASAVGPGHQQGVRMVVPATGVWGAASVDGAANTDPTQATKEIRVNMEQIDAVVREPVLLLKVDVSGYEQPVLESASTLLKHHVQHILMDYNPGVAEQRWTASPTESHKALLRGNPAGLQHLLDLGFRIGQMPDHWAKSGSVDYGATVTKQPWLSEVTAQHLKHDKADAENFAAGILGCPTFTELVAANERSWSRCNQLPEDAHPKSLRSSFGYNTNLWASKDHQLFQPGGSAGLFAQDQDMRHWVSLSHPHSGIGGVSCPHVPPTRVVRMRCKCMHSSCSEEQTALTRLIGQGRVAGAQNEAPPTGVAAAG